MSVSELSKSIESVRLNKRNKLPLGEPPRTIPFGALIEDVHEQGDRATFVYLGELYECAGDVLRSALITAGSSGHAASPFEPRPVPAAAQAPQLEWEPIESNEGTFSRARVPGGWLIMNEARSLAFLPDAGYRWQG